jgi:hypothetical protein
LASTPLPYKENGGLVNMAVVIPGRESRRVQIKYRIPRNLKRADLSKSNLRSSLLRHISDFRDLVLSRSRFGLRLTSFYYQEIDPETTGGNGRLYVLLAVPAVVILGLGFGYPLWKRQKSQLAQNSKRLRNH